MTQVKLLGELGDKFGTDWQCSGKSVREVLKLIDCQTDGFREYLAECHDKNIGFTIQNGEDFLDDNISELGLKLHEGDRLLNLGDNVAKGTAMKKFVSLMNIKNILTIAVGDSKNDIDMLDASDFPCLVYNKLTQLNDIDTERYFISNSEAPLGWAEVVKKVLNNLKGD